MATRMNPQPGRSITLQAYDGSPVPNSIDVDPAAGLVELARATPRVRILLASARPLGPPTGRYNCHGLVFASRRTNIPPAGAPHLVDIDILLQRDQYEIIESPPQLGDVIVYRNTRQQDIEHTGVVCRIDYLLERSTLPIGTQYPADYLGVEYVGRAWRI